MWAKVARATANNELGIAAKVSPREDPDRHRLVCIYTRDFNDKDDVARVLKRLKELDLVPQRQICYKTGRHMMLNMHLLLGERSLQLTPGRPDAFTYLGIDSENKLGLDVGKYRSDEMFAYLKESGLGDGLAQQPEVVVQLRGGRPAAI